MASLRAQAELAAEAVLEQSWDYGKFPVNPIEIAKKMGLKVFEAQLPGNVSGLLKKEPGFDAEIYLDVDDAVNRRRFTCAHELGHFVKRDGQGEMAYVERRDGESSEGVDPEEIYANAFAAALLMPASTVRALYRTGAGVAEMARLLHVSSQSLSYRLVNLGLVTQT